MSYRAQDNDIGGWISDLERRLRLLERMATRSPDPNWILEEIGGQLYFTYTPTGASGPVLGIQSGTVAEVEIPTTLPPSGAAGGVLSGTYPDPGFAVDMATQAELDAHVSDPTDAHDASAISYLGGPGIVATDVEGALDELATEKADVASAVMDGDAAGGVLSGTYPNPGFAVDMATQAELDAHITDASDAHDASAISYLGGPGIVATDVEGALDELATEKANIASPTFTGIVTTPELDISGTAGAGFVDLVAQSATPASPAASHSRLYAAIQAGKTELWELDDLGYRSRFQRRLSDKLFCSLRAGNSSTVQVVGNMTANTQGTVGTPGSPSVVGLHQMNCATAAAINSDTSVRSSHQAWYRGAATLFGGFSAYGIMYFPNASYDNTGAATGSRIIGPMLLNSTTFSVISSADAPVADYCGFVRRHVNAGATDANWQFVTSDNVGTTQIDTTMPFTALNVYAFEMFNAFAGGTVYWQIWNLTAGTTASGSTAATLPRTTQPLCLMFGCRTIDAVARSVQFQAVTCESDRP